MRMLRFQEGEGGRGGRDRAMAADTSPGPQYGQSAPRVMAGLLQRQGPVPGGQPGFGHILRLNSRSKTTTWGNCGTEYSAITSGCAKTVGADSAGLEVGGAFG